MAEQINVTPTGTSDGGSNTAMGVVIGIIVVAAIIVLLFMFGGGFGFGGNGGGGGTDTGSTGASSQLDVSVGGEAGVPAGDAGGAGGE